MPESLSLFRYPGGKRKLSGRIIEVLEPYFYDGKDYQYREPFFGGGCIGLELIDRGLTTDIWINDKDVALASLWTAVIRYPKELQSLIEIYTPSVSDFHTFKDELLTINTLPTTKSEILELGFRKLVLHQISYSGLGTKSGGPLGGEQQKSQYKINCRWSADYLCRKIQRLNALFAGVTIYEDGCTAYDFGKLLGAKGPAVFYLDPPYYVKGNDLYQCGFTTQDHIDLCSGVQRLEDPWVLSYDDCLEIQDLYEWAHIIPVDVIYNITALKGEDGSHKSRKKTELIITV